MLRLLLIGLLLTACADAGDTILPDGHHIWVDRMELAENGTMLYWTTDIKFENKYPGIIITRIKDPHDVCDCDYP